MKISEIKNGNVYILRFTGRVDSVTSADLETKINKLICQGEIFVLLNFANLEYISSAGLRVLLTSAKKIKTNNGKFMICSLKGIVKEVFFISGFNEILSIYENEEEALKHI